MICHVHRERLAALDPQDIVNKFVSKVTGIEGNIFWQFLIHLYHLAVTRGRHFIYQLQML